jgi:hypothetical protein
MPDRDEAKSPQEISDGYLKNDDLTLLSLTAKH